MSGIRSVAVLGAGHGGAAAAVILTLKGYEVRLHSRTEERLASLREGITVQGAYDGTVIPAIISTDLTEVATGADLIMLAVPSVAHEGYARALAPLLKPDQVLYLNPGHTGGGLHFQASLRAAQGPDVPLSESVTLTYICRMEGTSTVGVYRETANLRFAALPASRTGELIDLLHPLFPNLRPASNVLETGLININAVIHPPGMLMNAGWIEFTGGDLLFYKESITPSVAKVIEAVDAERLEIVARLGLNVPPFIDYFCEAGLTTEEARQTRSVYQAMLNSEPNKTIKSPPSLDHRYIHEDIGYGLVPMSEFGRLVSVPTPAMDSMITLASIAMETDYRVTGLNLSRMGLDGMSPEALVTAVT